MTLVQMLERRLSRGIEAQRRLKYEQATLTSALTLARSATRSEIVIRALLTERGIRLPETTT